MRKATELDVPNIRAALEQLLTKSPAPQMKFASLSDAEASIRQAIHEDRAYMVDGCLLLVSIGQVWYSRTPMLFEELVLKVEPQASADQVVAALDLIASHNGLRAIVTGDTQTGLMGKRYTEAGYQLLGSQFIKEI